MKFKLHCIVLLLVLLAACETAEKADLVITNANVYTVNELQPKAEAVAVRDGKIVYVGSSGDAQVFVGESTRVLDLQGKTLTPGLIESHAHLLNMGYNRMNLDLLKTTSYQQIIDMVAEAAKEAEPGEWILGRGWHQSKWDSLPGKMVNGFQVHDQLSEVSPDNPVWLRHASGHAGMANAKAMEIAGLSVLNAEGMEQEVEGGEVIRDENGNPTGIFNETAMSLITRHIPERDLETHSQALDLAFEECLENGITSFHDAGCDQLYMDAYMKALDENRIKVRMYVMLNSRDTTLLQEWYERGPAIGLGDDFLTVRSIKMYMDGALGSRGAWLLEEYEDRAGHYGHETTPVPYLTKVSGDALQHGFQVCSHAIGDRANREVLDQYEAAFAANPEKAKDHRFRIEHAQHLTDEDIPRFAEMGVIPSMQAIHMSSDRPWAIYRLGLARIREGAYVWKSLLESGARVINGTDAPVEPVNPIACFYASVSRKTLKGEPEGGYEPEQRMTREQALKSYTLDAAYGAFEEDFKGSIEVGKLADFTVYSQDLMQVPEDQLLNTKIDHTIVNGKLLYSRKGAEEALSRR